MKKCLYPASFMALAFCLCCAWAGSTPAADQKVEFKLAHSYQPTHAFSKGAKRLAEAVAKKTGGNFVINEFPAGQLGSEKDIADNIVNGIIELAIIGPGEIGKRYRPVLIFDGPFIFRDYDHAQKVLTGPVGKELWDGLEKATGIKELATLYYGTRYVTSKKPITKPEDMKGMKLRAPDMPLSVANARAMGANPTPMALSEVYLALQQNVVDGQENPIPTIYTQKFYEVQSHLAKTGHVLQLTPLFISVKSWNKLPEAYQKALLEAVAEVAPTINAELMNDEKNMLAEMQKNGMTVTEVDVEAFRQATQPVIKEFAATWGPGLYEKIQEVK